MKKRKVIHFGDFDNFKISACGVRVNNIERLSTVWDRVTCKNCLKQKSHYEPVKSEKGESGDIAGESIDLMITDEPALETHQVKTVPGRGNVSAGTM